MPVRSIPARAGETEPLGEGRDAGQVHPRACGGNRRFPFRLDPVHGPSPRVRGKHKQTRDEARWSGSIPARAGETLPG